METGPVLDARCLCGSGRAFAGCCATRVAPSLAAWTRRQEAERRLARSIIEHVLGRWGPDLCSYALGQFCLRLGSPSLTLALPVFDRWFAFTWLANHEDPDDLVPADWPSASLGVTWLASELPDVDRFDREMVVRAQDSPYSAFQVEGRHPGWALSLRDLLSGRRLLVVDPEISARARLDDILFTAVLTFDGVTTLLGPAPFALPSDVRFDIMELRRGTTGEWMTRAELTDWDMTSDICDHYIESCDRGAAFTLDASGDAREPFHLRWALSTSFEDTIERLRPLSVCYETEEAVDLDNGPDGDLHALISWYERGPLLDSDDWRMLGFLWLDGNGLAADVASKRNADRLIAEVAGRLGSAATLVDIRPSAAVQVHSRGCWVPLWLPRSIGGDHLP
jgi:hypothetical protein